jgi:hypothetical protein
MWKAHRNNSSRSDLSIEPKQPCGIDRRHAEKYNELQENPPSNNTVPSDQTTIGWRRIMQGKIKYNYQKLISTTFQFPDNNVSHIGNQF